MLIFWSLLFLAVQVAFNLHATTTVSAVAYDAARIVAEGGSQGDAEEHAKAVLGRFGAERVAFSWAGTNAEGVQLSVTIDNPHLLMRPLGASVGFDEVTRTVRVRVERVIES